MAKRKLLIWHWGRRGGGPMFTLELARALAERGDVETHLSLSRQSELFERTVATGLPGFHVDTYRGATRLAVALASHRMITNGRALEDYIVANGIQQVLCTMSHVWNSFIVPRVRRHARYVVVMHNAHLLMGERSWLLRRLLDAEIRQCDGLVSLTEHVRQSIVAQHAIPAWRTTVIPHGPFAFSGKIMPPRRHPTGRPFRIGFLGRILPYKGLSLLVEAMEQLAQTQPGLELHVFGKGDLGALAPRLRRLGAAVHNRWMSESQIAGAFEHLDILVLPYLEASQSGVIAGATAAALPVVATPVGGLVEQVRDGETGKIATAVSAEAVAAAIAALVRDGPLYEHCSAAAYRLATEELAWPRIADRLLDFTERVGGCEEASVGERRPAAQG
jgi:glycosyltransferase involved in cell wall biosynthesis